MILETGFHGNRYAESIETMSVTTFCVTCRADIGGMSVVFCLSEAKPVDK